MMEPYNRRHTRVFSYETFENFPNSISAEHQWTAAF